MSPAKKPHESEASQPELVTVVTPGNEAFKIDPVLAVAALGAMVEQEGAGSKPTELYDDLDPGVRARLEVLLNQGFNLVEAEIKLGVRPSGSATREAPKETKKRRPTGSVRVWDDLRPSGRDETNRHIEMAPTDPSAVGFPADMPNKLSEVSTATPLSKRLQNHRDKMREFFGATYVSFYPTTTLELDTAKKVILGAKGDGAFFANKFFSAIQGSAQGRTKSTWEIKRRNQAESAVGSKFNEWADYFEDSASKITLLTQLGNALERGLGTTLEGILDELKDDKPRYKMAFSAITALVQHMDLHDLAGMGPIGIPFNPLQTYESDPTLARESARKRILDAYSAPENAEKVAEHVMKRIKTIDSEGAKRMVPHAIGAQEFRNEFWKGRLKQAFEGTAHYDLADAAFKAAGIEAPK